MPFLLCVVFFSLHLLITLFLHTFSFSCKLRDGIILLSNLCNIPGYLHFVQLSVFNLKNRTNLVNILIWIHNVNLSWGIILFLWTGLIGQQKILEMISIIQINTRYIVLVEISSFNNMQEKWTLLNLKTNFGETHSIPWIHYKFVKFV